MFKGIRGLFILTVLVLALSVQVRADMTDKATLGGQSTTNGVYDWRVTSTGDLVPGTTAQNNLGSSTNKILAIFLSANGLQASGVNWTSFKALDASYGSHSGINWTSFGV